MNYVSNGSFEDAYCNYNNNLPDSVIDLDFIHCKDSIYNWQPTPLPPPTNALYYGYKTIIQDWLGIGTSPDVYGIKGGGIGEDYYWLTGTLQPAQNGKNYFGIGTMAFYNYLNYNDKEFIESKLKLNLKNNKNYCVSMWVSCANSCIANSSNMSIFFSDTPVARSLTLSEFPNQVLLNVNFQPRQ